MDFKEMDINTRNWVDSAQDRDYWRAFVSAEFNFRVSQAIELVSYYLKYYYSVFLIYRIKCWDFIYFSYLFCKCAVKFRTWKLECDTEGRQC